MRLARFVIPTLCLLGLTGCSAFYTAARVATAVAVTAVANSTPVYVGGPMYGNTYYGAYAPGCYGGWCNGYQLPPPMYIQPPIYGGRYYHQPGGRYWRR